MPDDDSAQNKGVEYWTVFGWLVDNNCLNIQKLTPILILNLYQRTELWVVPDDNSTRKQGVEDWTGIWEIITVSTVRN